MDHLTNLEEHLTKKQEGLCETMGILGALIAATCLVQHIVIMLPHWINYIILLVYIFSVVGFVLLAKKSVAAFPFVLISTILIFLLEAFMILMLIFSLVLLLLLFYSILTLILVKVYDIPKSLKQKQMADRLEREKWDSIL